MSKEWNEMSLRICNACADEDRSSTEHGRLNSRREVAYLLLLSNMVSQDSFQTEQMSKVLELCERKIDIRVSRTFSLLTSLLWVRDNDRIRKLESGNESSITFCMHKLNLTSFLLNMIKNNTWNVEIRKGIWMKITLSAVQVREHKGKGIVNANNIYWRRRSSKRKTNVWNEACVLIFDDSNRIAAKKLSLLTRDQIVMAFFKYISPLFLPAKDKTSNTLLDKSSSRIIKRQAVKTYSTSNLKNPYMARLSDDDVTSQIRVIARLLDLNMNDAMFVFNKTRNIDNRRLHDARIKIR